MTTTESCVDLPDRQGCHATIDRSNSVSQQRRVLHSDFIYAFGCVGETAVQEVLVHRIAVEDIFMLGPSAVRQADEDLRRRSITGMRL